MTTPSGGGDYDDYCLRRSTTKQPTRALLRHPSKSDHFPAKPKVTRIKIIMHHCQIHDTYVSTNAHAQNHHHFHDINSQALLPPGQLCSPMAGLSTRLFIDVLRMNLILVIMLIMI